MVDVEALLGYAIHQFIASFAQFTLRLIVFHCVSQVSGQTIDPR